MLRGQRVCETGWRQGVVLHQPCGIYAGFQHGHVHVLTNGLTAPEILRTSKAAGMLGFLQETRMPAELAQWITPAMFILGLLYLDRSIRNMRTEFRQGMFELRQEMKGLRKDLRVEIVNLCDHMDAQHEDLRRPHGPDRGDA